MTDNGENIDVLIDTAEMQNDREAHRITLGYLSANYESDEDISVVIYFRRTNEMEWETSNTITLNSAMKRHFSKLQSGLSVIDFYIKATSNVTDFQITSLKVFVKPVIAGKFG